MAADRGTFDQLMAAGGYKGWDPSSAWADFQATGGGDQIRAVTGGDGGGGSSSGSVPAFNYDYAKAATDAYGELGPYYTKLLTDSKGDINLALSRLMEDYDTGVRNKTQAANVAQTAQDTTQNSVERNIVDNANSRGLYTRSLDDPTQAAPIGPAVPGLPAVKSGGFGIADQNLEEANTRYGADTAARNTDLTNYVDLYGPTGVDRQRAQTDAATNITRKTEDLDQQRKTEAGDMANTRGSQAYQNYLATYSGGG
jgi:hypothetical protein